MGCTTAGGLELGKWVMGLVVLGLVMVVVVMPGLVRINQA